MTAKATFPPARLSEATSAVRLAPLDGVGSQLLPVLGGPVLVTAFADGAAGRLLARLLGLRPGTTIPGSLSITQIATPHAGACVAGEHWQRDFGGTRWASTLAPDDAITAECAGTSDSETADALVERVGPMTLRFDVALDASWVTTMALRSVHLGPLRVPFGRRCSLTARIAANAATDVTIVVPGGSCGYHVDFGTRL